MSSGDSARLRSPAFSSSRSRLRVPGIGTMNGRLETVATPKRPGREWRLRASARCPHVVDDGLVRLRERRPESVAWSRGTPPSLTVSAGVDCPSKEALAKRAEGNEPDAQLHAELAGSRAQDRGSTANTRSATRSRGRRRARGEWLPRRPPTNQSDAPFRLATNSPTAPATSSMGTLGSTRCW